MPTLGGSPALQSPPMGPKRRVVPPGAARTCRRGDRIATRRMSLVGRCCRKRDFAMSGEQHRFKIKCKCPILIQKSGRRDSIVSNSNSTVRLRRLFRQHRSKCEELALSICRPWRRLRDEYDIAQPLPGRLSDLLSQLGQPSEGPRAFPSDADTKKASVR
jgi:hypothetical protein